MVYGDVESGVKIVFVRVRDEIRLLNLAHVTAKRDVFDEEFKVVVTLDCLPESLDLLRRESQPAQVRLGYVLCTGRHRRGYK